MAHSLAQEAGVFAVPSTDVGTTVDLTGKWLFKPTNALAQGETPEASGTAEGYLPVPVPQMLSRIQWWLDDSEDFKKWEQDRLNALGFDTEKSDDGWYRLTFDCPQLPEGRRLWIEFEGVAMRSRTFLNGQPLGEHAGMFHRFAYDLTPHLKPGSNTLSMWVSMEKIPPTSGNLGEAVTVNLSAAKVISMSKGMFGPLTPNQDNRAYDLYGIWQPVKLVVRGAAKIEDVFFNPRLSGGTVDTVITAAPNTNVVLGWRIRDRKTDQVIFEQQGTSLPVPQSGRIERRDEFTLPDQPKLWTPAEPNLYRLEVTVSEADQPLDKWSHNVGFRTFEVKGNQLLLNGKPYWLRGANQLPYGKNPWDKELPRKLIQFMHDGNLHSTRTHCTPWNEAWLDAADEIGLAVSIEGIRPWAFAGKAMPDGKPATATSPATREIMPPPEIFQHWLMENADFVKRCRNHPSVFIFTIGNEMLLRDSKNLEKWKLISEVTKQTRQLAPGRPLVVSSDYVRDPEFYETTLKPAGIDDGDIDDMHRYNGWYADSPFVVDSKFEKEAKNNAAKRPIIGQEMSTGYPDLDTGLPVLRYTRDLLTPQAWVGLLAYPGNDPAPWLKHHAAVTKRWAEQLRWERGSKTAGFSLFSVECWFRHSFLPEATPYPVYDAMKMAFAPVGVAVETAQRRFWGGDTIATKVFVTNDDDATRDFLDLAVVMELAGAKSEPAAIASLPYYATTTAAVTLTVPAVEKRQSAQLITRLMQGETEISRTIDEVELFPRPAAAQPAAAANVIVVAKGQPLAALAEGQPLHQQISAGATAIVFSPSPDIVKLFPNDLMDVKGDEKKPDIAEFADWAPAAGTSLVQGLEPLDLKWWARKGDWRVFIAGTSHRLKPGGAARELIRYIPAHSYIPAEKVPEQYRVLMSEIPIGKGRLWICDFDFPASLEVDPVARLFHDNLHRAAADPESTRTLPVIPPHEELLKGARPSVVQAKN